MPVIDIQLILAHGEQLRSDLAAELANKLGQVLKAEPGRLWLRLQTLPSSNYAENTDVSDQGLPVFVTVMHAQAKPAEAGEPAFGCGGCQWRRREATSPLRGIGACTGRPPEASCSSTHSSTSAHPAARGPSSPAL